MNCRCSRPKGRHNPFSCAVDEIEAGERLRGLRCNTPIRATTSSSSKAGTHRTPGGPPALRSPGAFLSPEKEYTMHSRVGPIFHSLRRHWPASVAFLALGISIGGTAYANGVLLPRNSVGSIQIKPGAVTAPKLARNRLPPTRSSAELCCEQTSLPASSRLARADPRDGLALPASRGCAARPARPGLRGLQGRRVRKARRVIPALRDRGRCRTTRWSTWTASRWTRR